ncbi:hypothetical protein [Phaeospirillum tilakii]|uniref:YqaJ-like recombinase domain-containing protein n=1 Tax=Phaeospirillum tilakii TaxID=741673 RepID=A0ABW5CAH1_9PROT
MTHHRPAATRETTSLLALLDWTYRRQRADDGTDPAAELARLAGGPSPTARALAAARLGAVIPSTAERQRPVLHPDAALVADTVGLMDDGPGRALLVAHAGAGTLPEWGASQHLEPVLRDGAPLVVEAERIEIRYRNRTRRAVAVCYCPLQLWPDDSWVRMQRAEYSRWFRALETLALLLENAPLRRWRIDGLGVVAEPWNKRG